MSDLAEVIVCNLGLSQRVTNVNAASVREIFNTVRSTKSLGRSWMSSGPKPTLRSPGAPLRTRSVVRNGRKTSLSLEKPFWEALREIAERNNTTVRHILASIDQGKNNQMYTSAIRVFVIEYYMNAAKVEAR